MAHVVSADGSTRLVRLRDSAGRPEQFPPSTKAAAAPKATGCPALPSNNCRLSAALPADFPLLDGTVSLEAAQDLARRPPQSSQSACVVAASSRRVSRRHRAASYKKPSTETRAATRAGVLRREAIQAAALANKIHSSAFVQPSMSPDECQRRVAKLVQSASLPTLHAAAEGSASFTADGQAAPGTSTMYGEAAEAAAATAAAAATGVASIAAAAAPAPAAAKPRRRSPSYSNPRGCASAAATHACGSTVTAAMLRLMHGQRSSAGPPGSRNVMSGLPRGAADAAGVGDSMGMYRQRRPQTAAGLGSSTAAS